MAQAVRVDQAGEYGAVRIYQGQLAALRRRQDAASRQALPVVTEMLEQERPHLAYFEQQMRERQVRPTLLQPFWHVLGYGLGAVTAAMGVKAAMACTVAVESVIADHYAEQLCALPETEDALKQRITQFRDDEIEHHDTGLAQQAEHATAYPLLYHGIRGVTKLAIAVSRRL